ncbi:MAG: aminotransferase class III-fold pyridoxal phosphate-dependent enzyme [Methylococcaceae bacterium]|nr:MAG: aminotransferase class III-fold pyridoxal phosphate-dependent enzyme [Methylococcaceae bacterium]
MADKFWVGSNDYYLERQGRFESNARSYPRRLPIALKQACGVYVEDVDGRRYFDCLAGAGALALGHHHPVVLAALQQSLMDGVPFQTLDLTTPVKDDFVEELFGSLPAEFAGQARIQFCGPSGADAVEAAVKLVKTVGGRRPILAFRGAYHGMTHGALGLTGEIGPKLAVAGLMPEVHFLPFPYAYRCPFGLGGEAGWQASLTYIERLLDDANSGIAPPAAMILEAVQGEGGVIPAPDEWLRGVRRITLERDIPLIIDEVQTGAGRTGAMYAFEHAGILPDVLVLSKAIGGGLPLSVVVYHQDLDRWQPGAHAGTFRGNQLAMAAGAATLRFIREHRLERHAAAMGERLLAHLQRIRQAARCLGEVRGRGLMIGAEIVDASAGVDHLGAYPPSRDLARRIQTACLQRGLIVELGGRQGSVVRLLPPLIVSAEQVDAIAAILEEAVDCLET